MANLPLQQTLPQMQSKWKSQIDPVLSNLLIQGQLLPAQALINGTTVINHKLGRTPQGWFLVAPQASASVYQAAQQPNPTLTLTLVSNAAVTCSIWVF
jgi:hypothetical protein